MKGYYSPSLVYVKIILRFYGFVNRFIEKFKSLKKSDALYHYKKCARANLDRRPLADKVV